MLQQTEPRLFALHLDSPRHLSQLGVLKRVFTLERETNWETYPM